MLWEAHIDKRVSMQRSRYSITYILLVGMPVLGIILLIARPLDVAGVGVQAAAGTAGLAPASSVLTFILELVAILIAARLTGGLFQRLGQPRVVGEMLAGILVGPSVLGALAPELSAKLFPQAGF